MEAIEVAHSQEWSLAWLFNSTSSLLLINAKTVIDTWIILGIITLTCIVATIFIRRSTGLTQHAIIMFIDALNQLCVQTIGFFSLKHLSFITTLFIFILISNIAPLFPGLEEPTADLNTTLALGLIAFIYIQYESIKAQGIGAYIGSYFKPFFLLLPLNIIGKLATVMSMSFRLFGNIFGGALISQIYFGAINKYWFIHLICFALGINLLITGFFTVFEGALQAFVFTMLTLTHLGLALQGEGH